MIYGSWNIERDGQNFLSFWTIFYLFTLITQKVIILKKWQNSGYIIVLHKCTINENLMMYGLTKIFVILDCFLPFYPLTTQKVKILKNWIRTPGDIIISQKCIKNGDHMLYCSWNMVHDKCNYLSFWAIFCLFTSLTTWKIKIYDQMMYGSWDMVSDRQTDGQTDGKSGCPT